MPIQISAKRRFAEQAANGSVPIGTFITSFDAATSVVMANAGFDFVLLDCEHGPMNHEAALNHIRACQAHGIIPLVRVLENRPQLIQSYLDLGAQGIVVPKVETAEDARRAAAAGQYQPGGRGMCSGCDAAAYSNANWSAHVTAANANTLIIPLIETREGVRNLTDIVATDGVDVVMFGPGDLSQDMGLDLFREQAAMQDIWNDFKAKVRGAGKKVMAPLGLGFDGVDIGVESMDLMMLGNAARQIVDAHRARNGQSR